MIIALTGCALLAGCGGSTSPSHPGSTPAGAGPPPVDLTLPTTIHPGESNSGGASLSQPTVEPRVSWQRALALNDFQAGPRLTGKVLADVTMPNDFYRGKRIENLTCWVFVFTASKPFDPRIGGYRSPGSSPLPPMAVWHRIVIIDAANGQFVRGYSTK